MEQVKEKMAHIQALAHSTVGQTLPVRVQPWGRNLGWQLQQGLPGDAALAHSLSVSPDPSEEALPSIIRITWPLLFFEYEGNFFQVWGMRGCSLC